MTILVQAAPRDGYPTRCRAKRFWPSDRAIVIEVLDQEEDFRVQHGDGRVSFDPATTVEVEVRNPSTGEMRRELRPHPTRIGRSAYKQIMADKVLQILPADGAQVDPRDVFAASELEKAKARIAELEAQLWGVPAPAQSPRSDR
jgi:hypothetical protein